MADEARKRIMTWHQRYHISKHTEGKYLDLSNLYLQELPTEALKLLQTTPQNEEIEHLNFSFNDFSRLPVEIAAVKNLKELRVDNNKLKTLPNTFRNLTLLESLALGWNAFAAFPSGKKKTFFFFIYITFFFL
jgi:leucine-rich repeat protein SHOC2